MFYRLVFVMTDHPSSSNFHSFLWKCRLTGTS